MRRCRFLRSALVFAVASVISAFAVSSRAIITFERTYGGPESDQGACIKQTLDGGYVVAGVTHSIDVGLADDYLVKTDSLGELVWYYTSLEDSQIGEACGVCESQDGAYTMVGWTSVPNQGPSLCLTKISGSGEQLWRRTYGSNCGYDVQQTADGSYVVAGFTNMPGPYGFDVYLIKTDSVGDSIWARRYGGSEWDLGEFVQQTQDGGYVIVGYTYSFGGGGEDMYVVKTDSLGDMIWSKTYGGPFTDMGYCVRQSSDGGYIVAGYTYMSSMGAFAACVVRTDSSGDEVWTGTYGGLEGALGFGICEATDGGYVLAGVTADANDSADVYLVELDSLGGVVWSRTYGGSGSDWAVSIDRTTDGGYVVAGWTTSFGSGGPDVYVIKTDEKGLVSVCEPVEPPQVRSQGYWRRQCKDDGHEDICAYVDSVHILSDLFDPFDCDSICDLMNVNPPERDMCRKARRQFMGLLLNVASGKLAVCNCLEDSREVGDVIAEIDSMLSNDPDFHTCVRAKTLADDINNGISIVPCDTVWIQALPKSVQPPPISVTPNPFAKSTVIEYEVKTSGSVRLEIYDKAGRLMRTLADCEQSRGVHQIEWDGLNQSGHKVPQGIYFSRLQTGTSVESSKLLLLR